VKMVGQTIEISIFSISPGVFSGQGLTAVFLNLLQVWRESTRGSSSQANHDRLDRNRPGTDFYFRGSSYSVPDSRNSHRKPIGAIRSEGRFIILRSSLMSRSERKYCLISTSYLAGLFDIFILLRI